MNKKLEQEIVDIAPWMFRYKGWDDITKSLMKYGFAHGDGWFKILKELFTKIKKIDINKQVRIFQVKEKYATVRVYFQLEGQQEDKDLYDKIHKLINKAEKKTSKTCEVCGKRGKVRVLNGFQLKTLCNKCYRYI